MTINVSMSEEEYNDFLKWKHTHEDMSSFKLAMHDYIERIVELHRWFQHLLDAFQEETSLPFVSFVEDIDQCAKNILEATNKLEEEF